MRVLSTAFLRVGPGFHPQHLPPTSTSPSHQQAPALPTNKHQHLPTNKPQPFPPTSYQHVPTNKHQHLPTNKHRHPGESRDLQKISRALNQGFFKITKTLGDPGLRRDDGAYPGRRCLSGTTVAIRAVWSALLRVLSTAFLRVGPGFHPQHLPPTSTSPSHQQAPALPTNKPQPSPPTSPSPSHQQAPARSHQQAPARSHQQAPARSHQQAPAPPHQQAPSSRRKPGPPKD